MHLSGNSARIFNSMFSLNYKNLLADGSWRTALLNEVAPRDGERILHVHIQEADLSAEPLAKLLGVRLAAVNPIDPATEVLDGVQRLSFDHGRIGCNGAGFDKVLCCMALHPLASPEKLTLLKEMRRVLRSRGTLYVADLDKAFSKAKRLH